MITNQNIRRKIGRMDQAYSLADPYSSLEIRPVISNGAVAGFDPISAVYCPSTEKIYCGSEGSYIYAFNPNKVDSPEAISASLLHEDNYQYSVTSQYDSEYIPEAASENGSMHKIASFTNPGHTGAVELRFTLTKESGEYYYGYKITKNNGSSVLSLSNVVKEGCYDSNIDNGRLPEFDKEFNTKPNSISSLESKWPYNVTVEVGASDTLQIWVGGAMESCATTGGSSTIENASIKLSNFSVRAIYPDSLEECIVKKGGTRVRRDYISDYYSDFGLKNKYYVDGVYSPVNDSIYYAHNLKEGSDSTGKTYNGGFGIAKINPHTNMLEHDIPLFNFDPVTGEHFSMVNNEYDRTVGLLGERPINVLPLPKKLIYCPSNNKIYVLHGNPITSWVSVIDPAHDALLGSFTSDQFKDSSDIEYCPLNDRIYVANAGGDSISVINPHEDSGAASIDTSLVARVFPRDGFTHLLLHFDNSFEDDAQVSISGEAKLTQGQLKNDNEFSESSRELQNKIYYEENITKQSTEKFKRTKSTYSENEGDPYIKRWDEKDFNQNEYNKFYTTFDGSSCQKIPYQKEWGLTEDEFTAELWIKPDGNYFQTKPTYNSRTGESTYLKYDGGKDLSTAENYGDDSSMLLFSFGNVHNRLSQGTESFNDGVFGLILNQGKTYDDIERGKLSIITKSEGVSSSDFSYQTADTASASSGDASTLTLGHYSCNYCTTETAPPHLYRWTSMINQTPDKRPWVQFNFDNEKVIDRFEILMERHCFDAEFWRQNNGNWGKGYPGVILVEVSLDGTNWTLVERWTEEKRLQNIRSYYDQWSGGIKWYTYQFHTAVSVKHVRLTWDEPNEWVFATQAGRQMHSYGDTFVGMRSIAFWAANGAVSGKRTITPDYVDVDNPIAPHGDVKVKFNEWNHIAVVRRPKHTLSDSTFAYNSELSIYVNGLKWTTLDSNFTIDSESSPYLYLGGTIGDKTLISVSSIDYEKDELTISNSLPTWAVNGTEVNLYSKRGKYPFGTDEFTTYYLKKNSSGKIELHSSKNDAQRTNEPPLDLSELSSGDLGQMYLAIDTPWTYEENDRFYGKSFNWMHYAGFMNGFKLSKIAKYDKNFRPFKFLKSYDEDENVILKIDGDGSCKARNLSLDLESVGVLNTSANTAPEMDEIVDPTSIYPEKDLKWHGASFQLPLGWNDKDMITFKDYHGDFHLNENNFSISCEANFLMPDSLSNISSQADKEAAGLNQLISLFYYESDDSKVKYEFFVSKTSNGVSGLDTQGPGLYFKQYNDGVEVVSLFKDIYSLTLGNNTWNTFKLTKNINGTYIIIQNGTELASVTPTETLYPSSYSKKGKVKIGRGSWNKILAIGKVEVNSSNGTILNLDPNIANPQNLLGHCYIDRYAAKGKGPALREVEDIEILSLGNGFNESLSSDSWKPIRDVNGNAFSGLSAYEHKPKDGLNRNVALFKGSYSTSSTNTHALRLKSSGSYIKHLPITLGDPDRQFYKNPVWGYSSNDGDGPELGNNNFSIECTVMPLNFDDGTSTADVAEDMGLISFNYDTLNTSSVDWSDCPQYKFGSTRVYQGHVWNDSSSSCADSRGYGESLEAQARRVVWKTSSELINDAGYSSDHTIREPDFTPAADPWHSGASNTGKVGWEVKVNSSGYIEFNFGSMARNTIAGDLNHYYNGTARQLTSTTKIKYQSWYNINVTRIADIIYLYINGTKEAEINIGREHVLEHPLILGLTNYSKMGLLIGKTYSAGVTNSSSTASYFRGLMNEVRVRTPYGKGNHVYHPTQSPLLNKTEKSTIDTSLNLGFNSKNKDNPGAFDKKYDVNGALLRDYEINGRGNCVDYLHLNFDSAYKNKSGETEGVPDFVPNVRSGFNKNISLEEEGIIEVRNNDSEGVVRIETGSEGLVISGSSRYDLGPNFTVEGWYYPHRNVEIGRQSDLAGEGYRIATSAGQTVGIEPLVLVTRKNSNGGGWELRTDEVKGGLLLSICDSNGECEDFDMAQDWKQDGANLRAFRQPGSRTLTNHLNESEHLQYNSDGLGTATTSGISSYGIYDPEKTLISNGGEVRYETRDFYSYRRWQDGGDEWPLPNVDGWEHFAIQIEDSRKVTILMNGVGIGSIDISYEDFLNTNLGSNEKIVIGKGGGIHVDNIAIHNEVLYKNHKKVVALPWTAKDSDSSMPDGRQSGQISKLMGAPQNWTAEHGGFTYPARIPLLKEPHLFHYNNDELYFGKAFSWDHGIQFNHINGKEVSALVGDDDILENAHVSHPFDQVDQSGYLRINDASDFNFVEDFTVEFFFNCDNLNTMASGRRTLISKGDPNTSDHTFHISLDIDNVDSNSFSNGADIGSIRRARLVAEAGGVSLKAFENYDDNDHRPLYFYDTDNYAKLINDRNLANDTRPPWDGGKGHTHEDYIIQKYKHVMLCKHTYAGNSYLSLFIDKRLVASSFLRKPDGTTVTQSLSALTSTTYPLVIGTGTDSNGQLGNNFRGNINLIKIERGTNQNLCSAHSENLFRHLLSASSTASIDSKQNNNNNSSTWGTQTVSATELTSQANWNTGYMINGVEREVTWPSGWKWKGSKVTKNWIFESSLGGLDSHSKDSVYPDVDSWYLQENVLGDSKSSSLGLSAGTLLFVNASERIKDLSIHNRTIEKINFSTSDYFELLGNDWRGYGNDTDIDWGYQLPQPGSIDTVTGSFYTPPTVSSVGHFMGPLKGGTFTYNGNIFPENGTMNTWSGTKKLSCLTNIDPINKQDFGQHQYLELYDFVDRWDYFDEEFSMAAWFNISPGGLSNGEPAYIFKREHRSRNSGTESEMHLSLLRRTAQEGFPAADSYDVRFYASYKLGWNRSGSDHRYVDLQVPIGRSGGNNKSLEGKWHHVEVARKRLEDKIEYPNAIYTNGLTTITPIHSEQVVDSLENLQEIKFEAEEGKKYTLNIKDDHNRYGWSQPIKTLADGEVIIFKLQLITPRGQTIHKSKTFRREDLSGGVLEALEIDLFESEVGISEIGVYTIKNFEVSTNDTFNASEMRWLNGIGKILIGWGKLSSGDFTGFATVIFERYEWDIIVDGISMYFYAAATSGAITKQASQGQWPFPKVTGLSQSQLRTTGDKAQYYNDDITRGTGSHDDYWLPRERATLGLNFKGYIGEFVISTKASNFQRNFDAAKAINGTPCIKSPHCPNGLEKADKNVIWRDGAKASLPPEDIKFLLTFEDLEDHSMDIDRSKPTPSENTVLLLPFDEGSIEDKSGMGAATTSDRVLNHWIYNQPNITIETTDPLLNNTPINPNDYAPQWYSGDYTIFASHPDSSTTSAMVGMEPNPDGSSSPTFGFDHWTQSTTPFAESTNIAAHRFIVGDSLRLKRKGQQGSDSSVGGHDGLGPAWGTAQGPNSLDGVDNVYSLEFFFKPGRYADFDREISTQPLSFDGNHPHFKDTDGSSINGPLVSQIPYPPKINAATGYGHHYHQPMGGNVILGNQGGTFKEGWDYGKDIYLYPKARQFIFEDGPGGWGGELKILGYDNAFGSQYARAATFTNGSALNQPSGTFNRFWNYNRSSNIIIVPIIGGRSASPTGKQISPNTTPIANMMDADGCDDSQHRYSGGFFYVCMIIENGVGRLGLSLRGDTSQDFSYYAGLPGPYGESGLDAYAYSNLQANLREGHVDSGPWDSPFGPIFNEDNDIGYHHVYVVRQLGHWFVYLDGKCVVFVPDYETILRSKNHEDFASSSSYGSALQVSKTNINPTHWEISPDCSDMTCPHAMRMNWWQLRFKEDFGLHGTTAKNFESAEATGSYVFKFNGRIDGIRETMGGHSFNNFVDDDTWGKNLHTVSTTSGYTASATAAHELARLGRCGPGSAPIPYEVIDWDNSDWNGKDATTVTTTLNSDRLGQHWQNGPITPLGDLNKDGYAYDSNFEFENPNIFWEYKTWSSVPLGFTGGGGPDGILPINWMQARAEWLERFHPLPDGANTTSFGRWYPRTPNIGYIGGEGENYLTKSVAGPDGGLLYNDVYWYNEVGADKGLGIIQHKRAGGLHANGRWQTLGLNKPTAITEIKNTGRGPQDKKYSLVEAFTTQFIMFDISSSTSTDAQWWNEAIRLDDRTSWNSDIASNNLGKYVGVNQPISGFWKTEGDVYSHLSETVGKFDSVDQILGSACGDYDGTYYSKLEDSEDWYLEDEDFTIEFWYKFKDQGASENLGPFEPASPRSTNIISHQGDGFTWDNLGWAVELTYIKENLSTFFLKGFLRSKDSESPGKDLNAEMRETHKWINGSVTGLISPEMRFSFILNGHADDSRAKYVCGANCAANSTANLESLPISLKMGTPQEGVWEHYAIVRNGNVFTTFKNGKIIDRLTPETLDYKAEKTSTGETRSGTYTGNGFYVGYQGETYDIENRPYFIINSGDRESSIPKPRVKSPLNGYLSIGADTRFLNYNWFLNGNLDEIRISKDIARYTEEFKAAKEIVPGALEDPIFLGDSVSSITYCPPSKKLYAFSEARPGIVHGIDLIDNSFYSSSFSSSSIEKVSGSYFCPINNSILISSYDGSYKIYSFLPDSGTISKVFPVNGLGQFAYSPSVNRAYFTGKDYIHEIGH